MYPRNGAAPVDLSRFPQLSGVVDVIYNPLNTALLLAAKERGIACTSGLPMLIAQAKAASELFFHRAISDEVLPSIYQKIKAETSNIVLIGMPGCGKTAVGEKTAALSGKSFIDADKIIEEKAGMPIPEIFEKYGEAHFRQLEAEVLADIGKTGGQVIATGGGAVLRRENYAALKQNGRIYQLTRPVYKLALAGRPLSKSKEVLAEMEKTRAPYYRVFADAVVSNEGTVLEAANKIWEDFYENIRD